ncbi:hypothetical protein [Alteromonas sp. S015]|uniref:hypothetical protein n=1 Tax=Alteromonas sp. S015 TaxID=3117401 RepID=UPI002FE1F68B
MSSSRFNRNKWECVDAVNSEEGAKLLLELLSNQFPEPQVLGHRVKVDIAENNESFLMPLEKLLHEINSGVLNSPKLLVWLSSVFDEYFNNKGQVPLEDLLGLKKSGLNRAYKGLIYNNFSLAVLLVRDCKYFKLASDKTQAKIAEYFYDCSGDISDLLEHVANVEESIDLRDEKYRKYLETYLGSELRDYFSFENDQMPEQETFLKYWRIWEKTNG